jgi:RNA polymerase sigma factor (sigma-70 family)
MAVPLNLATCHMETVLPALISSDRTFQPRTHAMEQCELERELEQLHPESWGWALACCGRDKEVAEDVLQSAYLRIFSGRATFNGDSSLKTWVFGVIRWTARTEYRRRLLWFRRSADSLAATNVADRGRSADLTVVESDRREALAKGLAELSRRQREILQLVFYHDMTIEEAAVVMKVSLGSARTHYDRGKKALARKLAPQGEL